MKLRTLLVAALSLYLIAPATNAAPVYYTEFVSGDLPVTNGNNPLPTFTFDIGLNTVVGRMSLTGLPIQIDQDSFAFVVPAGMRVESATVVGFNDNTNFFTTGHTLNKGTALYASGMQIEALTIPYGTPPITTAFTSTPLGEGLYNMSNYLIDAQLNTFGQYVYSFVVESDAVPASADFDIDGDVDGHDFLKWQRGESTSPLSGEDLTLWQEQYGSLPPLSSVQVPEPTSGIFLVAAIILTLQRVKSVK